MQWYCRGGSPPLGAQREPGVRHRPCGLAGRRRRAGLRAAPQVADGQGECIRRVRGRGGSAILSSRITIVVTWASSRPSPLPVTAAFTSLGVCSATGSPRRAGAQDGATPACAARSPVQERWPRPDALHGDRVRPVLSEPAVDATFQGSGRAVISAMAGLSDACVPDRRSSRPGAPPSHQVPHRVSPGSTPSTLTAPLRPIWSRTRVRSDPDPTGPDRPGGAPAALRCAHPVGLDRSSRAGTVAANAHPARRRRPGRRRPARPPAGWRPECPRTGGESAHPERQQLPRRPLRGGAARPGPADLQVPPARHWPGKARRPAAPDGDIGRGREAAPGDGRHRVDHPQHPRVGPGQAHVRLGGEPADRVVRADKGTDGTGHRVMRGDDRPQRAGRRRGPGHHVVHLDLAVPAGPAVGQEAVIGEVAEQVLVVQLPPRRRRVEGNGPAGPGRARSTPPTTASIAARRPGPAGQPGRASPALDAGGSSGKRQRPGPGSTRCCTAPASS